MNKKLLPELQYMSGAGNIFTVFDNRHARLTVESIQSHIQEFCSVGNEVTEGVMAIDIHPDVDFTVEYINPDGSHGSMCGNGSRCAVLFYVKFFNIDQSKAEKGSVRFYMAGTLYKADYSDFGAMVSVYFPAISLFEDHHLLNSKTNIQSCAYIENGSDHAIIFASDIETTTNTIQTFPLKTFAQSIRHDISFPRGCNVNVVFANDNTFSLRTFERGVERETGACGTGALASAYALHTIKNIEYPISLHMQSGDVLTIGYYDVNCLYLKGPALLIDSKQAEQLLSITREKSQ